MNGLSPIIRVNVLQKPSSSATRFKQESWIKSTPSKMSQFGVSLFASIPFWRWKIKRSVNKICPPPRLLSMCAMISSMDFLSVSITTCFPGISARAECMVFRVALALCIPKETPNLIFWPFLFVQDEASVNSLLLLGAHPH